MAKPTSVFYFDDASDDGIFTLFWDGVLSQHLDHFNSMADSPAVESQSDLILIVDIDDQDELWELDGENFEYHMLADLGDNITVGNMSYGAVELGVLSIDGITFPVITEQNASPIGVHAPRWVLDYLKGAREVV